MASHLLKLTIFEVTAWNLGDSKAKKITCHLGGNFAGTCPEKAIPQSKMSNSTNIEYMDTGLFSSDAAG